jgi:WD40 repeat protein
MRFSVRFSILCIIAIAMCAALAAALWKAGWVGRRSTPGVAISPARVTLDASGEDVASVAFSPDGKLVAAGTWSGSLLVWNTEDGHLVAQFKSRSIMAIAFSPDGQRLVTASGGVQLWDIAAQREIARIFDNDYACCVAFSPDGQRIAIGTGSPEGNVWLWDAETNDAHRVFHWANNNVIKSAWPVGNCSRLAFSPTGQSLAAATYDGVILLNTTKGGATKFLAGYETSVTDVAYLGDGETIVGLTGAGKLLVWNGPSAQLLRTLELRPHQSTNLSVARGSKLLALASNTRVGAPGRVVFFDLTRPQPICDFIGHDDCLHQLAFSPDGKTLVTGATRGFVKLWNVDDFVTRE